VNVRQYCNINKGSSCNDVISSFYTLSIQNRVSHDHIAYLNDPFHYLPYRLRTIAFFIDFDKCSQINTIEDTDQTESIILILHTNMEPFRRIGLFSGTYPLTCRHPWSLIIIWDQIFGFFLLQCISLILINVAK
jgi:hypothetical protein